MINGRRHFLRNLLVAAASLSTLSAGCSKEGRLPAIPAGTTVLAFGDSVTYGTGAGSGEDWPSLLAQQTGWDIINAGIPGDTAEAGKDRITALLNEYSPALVIIEIGGNDFLRRRPASAVKEDIRHIVHAVRAAGAQPLLVAVPELSLVGALTRSPSDSPIFQELAKEEGLPLVSDVFSDILGQPALCADKIHPNALGYARMAEGIHAYLRQLGLSPSRQ
jgi:acyl-CoA thioesterase I